MTTDIPKQFEHREVEGRIYKLWEQSNVFRADVDSKKPPFCVVIPPPNVTGILHMGHVLDNTPQDIMTRWHRMRGYAALWIPGTDHAGIATQSVVIKNLAKEGIKFRDLGREKFIEKVWEWKHKHGDIIINQLKRLGCSCDWSRERFTMDEGFSRAVLSAFLHLYQRGLIYRGERMINWCTVCGTALSDDEVEHEDRSGSLWHLKYPILNSDGSVSGESLIVATTRPETMLGDTGVAVHPDDERYTALHGRSVLLPIQNRIIPVIADSFVDPAFGTGVVKLTPAHDPNDCEVAKKRNLPFITVIGLDGRMTADAGPTYLGLSREEARKRVVADLEASGYLEKIEPYKNAVGTCYRCKSVVEPTVSKQWFVKMRPLAEKAVAVVEQGKLNIVPDSEKHDYFHWMNNIQDWCISRQLWWGHRIPVYYCDACEHVNAALSAPEKCEKCGHSGLRQDDDVLDTWFSSQLWPFGTLGWPEKTEELSYWFPNSWLMSGRDILFFWDARMIMSALELMGDVPFRTLALHGLVRDEQGRKLSKSLGNSPDPLELFDQYGTDSIRAAITLHYPMGRSDTKLGDQMLQRGQSLIIKLWNATRLLLMNLENRTVSTDISKLATAALEDRWILARLSNAIQSHDAYLSQSDFSHALDTVNSFFWDDYCDWYLESIKPRLRQGGAGADAALSTAFVVHGVLLRLLHPYCPFITEELWQQLRGLKLVDAEEREPVLALAAWPKAVDFKRDAEVEARFEDIMALVRGVRDVRQNLVLGPKVELAVHLAFFDGADAERLKIDQRLAQELGFLSSVAYREERTAPPGTVPFRVRGGMGYAVLPPEVDVSQVVSKLNQRIQKNEKVLGGITQKLANQAFVSNAPAELVAETKAQAREMEESVRRLVEFRDSIVS